MKKIYRCPHCGKETITFGKKLLASYTSRGARHRQRGACCPACGGRFHLYHNKNLIFSLVLAVACFFAPQVISFLFQKLIGESLSGSLLLILYALSAVGIAVIYLCLIGMECPLVNYNREMRKYIIPEYNAVVSVDTSAKIKELMVYGLIPDRKTMNIRFKERFRDGIVPAMFLQKRSPKGNQWLIFVIDTPEIPDEMLAPGTTFSLIYQGKELTRGRFEVKKD